MGRDKYPRRYGRGGAKNRPMAHPLGTRGDPPNITKSNLDWLVLWATKLEFQVTLTEQKSHHTKLESID